MVLPSRAGNARERILLVDDDAGVRGSLSEVLASEGCVVIPASDGQQASDLAASKAIDLVLLAAGALAYATVRFVEAYGLWRERVWAEWFAVASSGIYLPIEVWELAKGITWPRVLLFAVNLAIVA